MTKPNTPVDVSKIRPGDKVTSEHVVHSVERGHVRIAFASGSCKCTGFVLEPNELVAHLPAQRDAKVGSKVLWSKYEWEIIAIRGKHAWIYSLNMDTHVVAKMDSADFEVLS